MKRLWNAVCAVALTISLIMVCATHVADNFFKEDLAQIILDKTNIVGTMDSMYAQLKTFMRTEDQALLEEIKTDFQNNEEIKEILSTASKQILADLADGDVNNNQDMTVVLKDMIYSYDEEMLKLLSPLVTKEQWHGYVEEAISTIPVQMIYDTAIETFHEELPSQYLRLVQFINLLASTQMRVISIVVSLAIIILLVILNLRSLRFSFSLAMGFAMAGGFLLMLGQVVPLLYQKVLEHLDASIATLAEQDFHVISIYAMLYLGIAAVFFLLHFITNKRASVS